MADNNKKVRDNSNSEEGVLPIGNILRNNSINSNSNSNSRSIGIVSYRHRRWLFMLSARVCACADFAITEVYQKGAITVKFSAK